MDKYFDPRVAPLFASAYVEFNGRLFVVESVPARVNVETGEHHFSPETVERLQGIVHEQRSPVRSIRTPVYEFV